MTFRSLLEAFIRKNFASYISRHSN